MKAWVLHDVDNLKLETTDLPVLGNQEVLVAVKAAGICGSDIPRIYRTGTYSFPLIPGHEFSGLVAETSEGVSSFRKGQRVGIFPLIPCGSCMPCQHRQFEMCRHYSYLGSRRDGGFAEYVAVPASNLIRLPDDVTYEEAAMLEPMAVAVHAMRRIAPLPTDTVVICGLGTIGLLLFLFLKEAGIQNILAVGNKDFQRQTLLNMGLPKDDYCDSRSQDVTAWLMERTSGNGVDVFFECVGKNETLSQAVDNTAPAGRIMLVGNPASQMKLEKSVYWKILRNQLTVKGTWNSSFTNEPGDDWHYVLERLSTGRIQPAPLISHRFSLEELEQGLHLMRDKTEDYVKIIWR